MSNEKTEDLKKSNSETFFDEILSDIDKNGYYSELSDLDNALISSADNNWGSKKSDTKNVDISKVESKVSSLIGDIKDVKKRLNSLSEDIAIMNENSSKNDLSNSFLLLKNDLEDNNDRVIQSLRDLDVDNKTRDKAFEKLYEQLDMYKNNFLKSLIKPFITDLLLFYDRICENISTIKNENSSGSDTLGMFKDELLEILSRNGISPMEKSDIGDKFDPRKSNALKRISTEDKDLDLCIEQVVHEGFTHDDKVVRPESVVIYRYKKSKNNSGNSESFYELQEILSGNSDTESDEDSKS
ncbi:MAG: nucleotide exchange factor GrpE [Candidatus Cloacimonadota bacterium]|nr:MAG: nucleotide exchange factor GrpE [Candidatus Cloacimonadota bacterium]PIE77919.1 MAG: nucleotide exchange factor GrpE [Candidatus Delongbacteria bacterium]